MSRRILIFQHVAHEILGSINPLLKDAGFRIRYVNFGRDPDARPRLDGSTGLVVLGGPMNVGDADRYPHLDTEIALLTEAVERGMPVLGICLGAQLLARALGANVGPGACAEIGWGDVEPTTAAVTDPLLRHLAPTQRIFQWHGDTFSIPAGATHLASSPVCRNQAFRFGERAWGFQFHLEVDQPLVERWLTVPVNQADLDAVSNTTTAAAIRAETRARIADSLALSRRVFGEFVHVLGKPQRRRMLRSR